MEACAYICSVCWNRIQSQDSLWQAGLDMNHCSRCSCGVHIACYRTYLGESKGDECSRESTLQKRELTFVFNRGSWTQLSSGVDNHTSLWLFRPKRTQSVSQLQSWHQLLLKLVMQGMKDDSCLTVRSGVTDTVSYKRKTKKPYSALSELQKDFWSKASKMIRCAPSAECRREKVCLPKGCSQREERLSTNICCKSVWSKQVWGK